MDLIKYVSFSWYTPDYIIVHKQFSFISSFFFIMFFYKAVVENFHIVSSQHITTTTAAIIKEQPIAVGYNLKFV